jgi:hypothetical protein
MERVTVAEPLGPVTVRVPEHVLFAQEALPERVTTVDPLTVTVAEPEQP